MGVRANTVALAVSAALFAAGCFVMSRFGAQVQSSALVYPFMITWGASALGWPVFALRAVRAASSALLLRRARRRRYGRRLPATRRRPQ